MYRKVHKNIIGEEMLYVNIKYFRQGKELQINITWDRVN